MSVISSYSNSISASVKKWLKYHFLERKLKTIFGYLTITLVALYVTSAIALVNVSMGPALVAIFGVILFIVVVLKYPSFGLYFGFVYSSIIATLNRYFDPVSFFGYLEFPLYLLIFMSIMLKYEYKKELDKKFLTAPPTLGLYLLFFWWILEGFNPSMFSRMGWLSYFRNHIFIIIFYIICYCLLNSKARIIFFVYFFIGLSTCLALYACKQEWLGFFEFEARTIRNNPTAQALLFQGGIIRKFSTFSDPAASGICFAAAALQATILAWRDNGKARIWLFIAIVINLLGYSYSGTRTATLIIAGGIAFYMIATFYEKRTLSFVGLIVVLYLCLSIFNSQNPVVARIKTAFDGSKDASASLRDFNRHNIQPYVLAHPMGGGVFTSGAEGPKYNPGHFLEKFQPDSGYAKTMAEEGTIGLAILLFFYLMVTREGIKNFYRARDPEIQNHYIASLVMFFSLLIAQYAQLSVSQNPMLIYFYGNMVIFTKLIKYDTKAVQLQYLRG
ncbi:MAG: O-antigen ligase family protein [Chitinophagales bacterium]